MTDEANIVRTYWADGLGRMTAVTEPDGTITNYGYDVLDNLASVSAQNLALSTTCPKPGTTQRSFVYSNPLSRLRSATNLESGTVSYTYDGNGNLTNRTDANGSVMTASGYDGLNRPLGFSYTTAGNVAATPNVTYGYDQACTRDTTNFKGAVSSVGAGGNSTCYTHDGFGRIIKSKQTTATPGYNPFQFIYGYSLTDQLISMMYPSLRQVNYNLDSVEPKDC